MTVELVKCYGSNAPARVEISSGSTVTCNVCGVHGRAECRGDGRRYIVEHYRLDPYRGLPLVMPNEDGEVAWAAGHIGSHRFVRGMIRSARVDGWMVDLEELFEDKPNTVPLWRWLPSRVRHVWMRQSPTNEEQYLYCTPRHPSAEAFTQMDIR